MEWMSIRSLERKKVESAVIILLNIRTEKNVKNTIESNFLARMSPNSGIP